MILKNEHVGKKFTCTIWDTPIVDGVIQKEGGNFYLCQNVAEGSSCKNKMGYTFSYVINSTNNIDHQPSIKNFQILEGNPWDDWKIGDMILFDKTTFTIQGIVGKIVFLNTVGSSSWNIYTYTMEYLYALGYRKIEPKKELPIVEMSVKEVAKKLGIDPSLLKIVDK